MTTFVLDSNIISYFLKGHELITQSIRKTFAAGDEIIIAPVAYYEVKRGLALVNAQRRLKEFLDFCEEFGVGQFDNCILDIAVEIYTTVRKKGRIVEDADIFIAAFCKQHGFTLVTNNTKHFENIPELALVDWSNPIKQ